MILSGGKKKKKKKKKVEGTGKIEAEEAATPYSRPPPPSQRSVLDERRIRKWLGDTEY